MDKEMNGCSAMIYSYFLYHMGYIMPSSNLQAIYGKSYKISPELYTLKTVLYALDGSLCATI